MLTVSAIVALLIWIDPVVATLTFLIGGGLYLLAYLFSRSAVSRLGETRAAVNRDRYRVANEALAGVKEIKLLGRERSYIDAYSQASFQLARSDANSDVYSQVPQYAMQIVAFGGMIVLCLALLNPTELNNSEALGNLIPLLGVIAFAGQRMIPELAKIYGGMTQLSYGAAVMREVYNDLKAESDVLPVSDPDITPLGLSKELELQNVSYHYPGAEDNSLKNISFSIHKGERIGIVGSSGSGKTTLADVLMGLLEVSDGKILVDGISIDDDNVGSWQRSVGYVQQEIFLSDCSILENIALGVPAGSIDRERAITAAKMSRLDQFVNQNLPDGYETIVGERGVRLSGGQRQRIGIARALYNNADVIVFDEATSALDNVTELQVMESIDALAGTKTVILIAHRLTTLENCDRLVVLDHGEIVGIGPWSELLESNPQLQQLVSAATMPGADSTA